MPSLDEENFTGKFHEFFIYSKKNPGFESAVEQKFQVEAYQFLKLRRFNVDAVKYVESMEDFMEQYLM